MMTLFSKKLPLLVTALSLVALPALAMDLASTKKQGLVGERPDGLIGIVTPQPTAELKAFVEDINAGRMMVYSDTAEKQGISIDQVKVIAGQKIYQNEPAGNYVMYNNAWSVK